MCIRVSFFFFFQAEDGIRDAQESRGLGDVYKRQAEYMGNYNQKYTNLMKQIIIVALLVCASMLVSAKLSRKAHKVSVGCDSGIYFPQVDKEAESAVIGSCANICDNVVEKELGDVTKCKHFCAYSAYNCKNAGDSVCNTTFTSKNCGEKSISLVDVVNKIK
eukprot:TRINITY_DN1705_c0_g1_i7.p1 TRINITY_DN1705_c0_g1~~TRINITY_DN1705_c0_g1_i7.p1  ORF type:complete len:162 (-),score=59.64 TRINITY_DN1705_c0_g1_i7:89-574(-)